MFIEKITKSLIVTLKKKKKCINKFGFVFQYDFRKSSVKNNIFYVMYIISDTLVKSFLEIGIYSFQHRILDLGVFHVNSFFQII